MVHSGVKYKIQIVKAKDSDSPILTDIAFSTKRHWNYPERFYEIWKDELTISRQYIEQNMVYTAMLDDLMIGFYSLVENKADFYSGDVFVQKGFWLEHIFVRPDYHGLGVGRQLINHLRWISGNKQIHHLFIFVDPNARGFYDKVGAKFLYNAKSSIPDRWIPVYELKI